MKLLLLDENSIQLNIAIVHDQVLLHEALQRVTIDHIKSAVLSQAAHQALHTLLVGLPLLDMTLDLDLSI